MKLLVTGAAGFIGSHLVERLLAEGHDVVGLDSFDTYLYDAETKAANLAGSVGHPRFRLVTGDILDRPLVAELCRGQDVIVHLAALAGVRPSIEDPPRYARTNVEGTTNVLEACRLADVRRLIFASSSSVYGTRDPASVPFREDDPCLHPASPYAATKRSGELLSNTYRDLHGIGISALRFFTVYGPRQRPEMAIHKFARAIVTGAPVTLFGDGSSARDYTFIDDVIDGTYAACNAVVPGVFRIYNLGGSRTTTLARLVELLGEALGASPRIVRSAVQPGDVPITCADVTLAKRDLGYEPKVPIEEGLRRFATWFLANAGRSRSR